jgi:hypothetical protein
MESTSFFEKKISLTPSEFNEVKNNSIDSLLEKKAKSLIENKCSENGFVMPGTVRLISRSMGYFEAARFTGDAVYFVKVEGKVVYPADGVRVVGEVIRKNKMGLYVDYNNAIRIQVPRDLHIGSEEYENVEVGDLVEVELKRSKFQINDPYILASAIFITSRSNKDTLKSNKTERENSKEVEETEEEEEEEEEEKEEEEETDEVEEAGEEEETDEVEEAEEEETDEVEETEDEISENEVEES